MSKYKLYFLILIFFSIIYKISGQVIKEKSISVEEFGVYPVSLKRALNETESIKHTRWINLKAAFEYCIANQTNLFFPRGVYDVGSRNFPFRNVENSHSLLDCNNITIFGEGRGTILMTTSLKGADVLQLNMISNIKIKHFDVTAILLRKDRSGSNGISITNGWDNIHLEDIICYNLPGIDYGTYIDGAKALTIQSKSNGFYKGKINALNIKSINCAYGFRFDGDHLNEFLDNNLDLNIEMDIDRAYKGFSISFGTANKNINYEKKMRIKASAILNNCQQSIDLSRVIGGEYSFILTKSLGKEKVLYNKYGARWNSSDIRVYSFLAQAPKNIKVYIRGNAGEVDRIFWIGAVGRVKESFNFTNRTENSSFVFDVTGNSLIEDFTLIEFEGNSIYNSEFSFSKDTAKGIAISNLRGNNNNIIIFIPENYNNWSY